mgnify:CR=1 FL=1
MGRKTKHNAITSDELLSKVNPENVRLVSDYIDYLKSTKKSPTTIAVYKNDLDIAWVWCLKNNNNKFFVNWTKRDIVSFQNYLVNENENSPARVRRIKATLSSLSNYIESVLDDEYPNFRNIIHKIENPPLQPVREKTVWGEDELDDLLDKLMEQKEYEKACLLALARYSGRRKAELCRFRVSDFDEEHLVCDGALYKSSPIKSKGRGGGKYISCYTLAKKFKPYLEAWMIERTSKEIDSEWLFPSKENPKEQISISTLNSWADTFSRMTGRNFYMHSLRHSFTTNLVRAGIPDGVIQSLIAWESAEMVRTYTDIDADESISMYFKNGDISVPERKSLSDV